MSPGSAAQTDTTTCRFDHKLLTRLLGELPDAVVVVDSGCLLRWGNHAAERLFGRTLNESVGISGLELVHPDDLELVLRSLVSVQEKEVGAAIEIRVNATTGWRLVELLGAPVSWLAAGAWFFSYRA